MVVVQGMHVAGRNLTFACSQQPRGDLRDCALFLSLDRCHTGEEKRGATLKIKELSGQAAHLINLNNINVIMGRNGAGKSRFLRDIDQVTSQNMQLYNVRYVSPERAGSFKRDGNVLTNMSNDPTWLRQVRSVNQASNFKAASAMLFREAETLYLRRLASTPEIRMDTTRNFDTDRLSKVNQLLTNISLEMGAADFEFRSLADGQIVSPDQISSGESEAVALAAEILYFFDTIDPSKFNVLLLDEPDVHLHPDLQARLGKLIIAMLEEFSDHAESIAICLLNRPGIAGGPNS
ncbi:AAA family ATPase [Sphingopyxis witflariensis]|uniref:AAA family ATPase n=1 Tax=Sphingopyxis witflariensis TaxID=173675 RepID=UPI00191C7919|nr:AAA family ATPase [Sphingopyxis witflariensis]